MLDERCSREQRGRLNGGAGDGVRKEQEYFIVRRDGHNFSNPHYKPGAAFRPFFCTEFTQQAGLTSPFSGGRAGPEKDKEKYSRQLRRKWAEPGIQPNAEDKALRTTVPLSLSTVWLSGSQGVAPGAAALESRSLLRAG